MLSPELIFVLIAVVATGGFFVLVGLIVGLIVWHVKKAGKDNLETWKRTAGELKLQLPDPKNLRLTGKYNDLEVDVGTRAKTVSMYGRIESFQFTSCTARFPQPLGLSLYLKYPRESDLEGSGTGQTDFDSNFDATCSNQTVLFELLSSPTTENRDVLGDILQTKRYVETNSYQPALVKIKHEKTNPTLLITDDSVFIEFRTKFGEDSRQLKQLLDVTTNLARQIRAARSSLKN